jgi:hypothetical protein
MRGKTDGAQKAALNNGLFSVDTPISRFPFCRVSGNS